MRTWLKAIRKCNKMTCNHIAAKSNISRQYYCMIEKNLRTPSVKIAKAIAKVLGFDWTLFYIKDSQE